jgi:hypothetical protein
MKEIHVYKFNNNVKVCYTNKKISLPKAYRDSVEIYWNSLLENGKNFFRGDIFTITNISCYGESVFINVELTDYAHFLYTIYKNEFNDHDCRVIHTSVLVETADGKFAIGIMGNDTFAPQKLQFVGGGIDKADLNGEILDLEHNIRKEIAEELGLDTGDKSIIKDFKPYLIKDGGKANFLSAIFKLDLCIDGDELMDRFERFNQGLILKGTVPELSSLVLIIADQNSVENFINSDFRKKDENLIPTLKAAVGLCTVGELIFTDERGLHHHLTTHGSSCW